MIKTLFRNDFFHAKNNLEKDEMIICNFTSIRRCYDDHLFLIVRRSSVRLSVRLMA